MLTIFKISKFFLYASLFSVTVVMSTTFFPFIGGKYYFFRFMIELSLITLLLWWAFEAPAGDLEARLARLFRQPLFIAVSLFVFAFLLATVFADNPQGAFWSNYERGEGGFQMLHYYLFFVLLGLLMESVGDWRLALRLSMIAAIMMIGYGLLAASFVPGFIGPYNQNIPGSDNLFHAIFSTNRFQGSLGNPAYVAPYLIFIMFYVAWEWVTTWRETKQVRFIYGVLILFFLTFFILSQTRGAFLGLVAGIGAYLGYLILFNRRFRLEAAIGVFALAVGGALLYSNLSGRPDIDQLPGGRLFTMSISETSVQTRFWTWSSAFQGFLVHPFFGWGPENFSTVFDRYFNTNFFVPGVNMETWFDRAHSVFFGYLAETGFLGTATFLGMFGVFYYEFFRRRSPLAINEIGKANGRDYWFELPTARGLLFAIPIAYLVQGLILFDVLPIYINLFLTLAFGSFLFEEHHRVRPC